MLFTVVIPTRNRAEYLKDAIASIRQQTFKNWEIIVSDNSNDDVAEINKSFVESMRDARIRYIRPSSVLSMVKHWEWAFEHANGEYVGIVTDRMALRHHALDRLAHIVSETAPPAICYQSHNAKELPGYLSIKGYDGVPRYREISSLEKLNEFSRGKLMKDSPRVLNSFVKHDLLRAIRTKYGKIFDGNSPDYFMAFTLMDTADTYVSVDEPLLIVQGEHLSNGRANATGVMNEASIEYWKTVSEEQSEFLRFGPIPYDIAVMPNVILREYEAVAHRSTSGRFKPILPEDFYREAVRYASNLARSGYLSGAARKTLDDYALQHGFKQIPMPSKRNRPIEKLRNVLNGERAVPFYSSAVLSSRRVLDAVLMKANLSSTISGKTIGEVLTKDRDSNRGVA